MRNNNKMKIFFLIISTSMFSQGAWDLKYIPIDSMNNSFINKEIRLDFKNTKYDIINGNVSVFDIRRLLSHQDTVTLGVKGKLYNFTENWKIYDDYGVLREQTLVSFDKKKENDETLVIKEVFIMSIDDTILKLKINIYTNSKCKKTNEELEIVVSKYILKGLLLRAK